MQDNGFFELDGAHYIFYLDGTSILLFPRKPGELTPPSLYPRDDSYYIDLVGSKGIRGAIWTHSANIEHTRMPFNDVIELQAKYIYSRWDGIDIGGIDIFGEAIDDLFFIDNITLPIEKKTNYTEAVTNIVETWSVTYRERQLQVLLLFDNTLSFRGRNNLEFRPIIRVVVPGQENFKVLSKVYESILNFIRLVRYRLPCGNIETKLIDNSESHNRIGFMLTGKENLAFEKRYAIGGLSFWRPYIQRLLQFVFVDDDLTLNHFPVDHFHSSPHDFDPITVSRLFTAFENECHMNRNEYEDVDSSTIKEIKARIIEKIKNEKNHTQTEEEKKFVDDSINRISQLGTSIGQKAKILRAFESVYPVLHNYLPYMLNRVCDRAETIKEQAKKLLGSIPSLRATILHDGNNSLISQDQAKALVILELIVYIQMLRRSTINDKEIETLIGFVFGFNPGNYTYLTPD
jgi:hypothetical protein